MKRALIIFLLSLASFVTPVSQTKTDRERDGLKGPVQTVRVRKGTLLDENDRQTQGPVVLSHAVTYDQSGNRIERTFYDHTGTFSRRLVYTLDPQTKKKSGLISYDSQNSMVRKVVDTYGSTGLRTNSNIHDYAEDGTLFRRTELTFDGFGLLVEVATYGIDGSLIKRERAPFVEPEGQFTTSLSESAAESADRLVSFGGSGSKKLDEPDSHGNWTEGFMPLSSRTYESGKKIKVAEVVYREFTYYKDQE